MIFCTLFDSGYLDKGLALLYSLHKVCDEFRLYIVAFDSRCYEVLSDYSDENLVVINLDDFETPELLIAKSNRTNQEYCWTCSCHCIKYVLEVYGEHMCTYIDADMFFFQNPQILFDEISKSGCDVSIIEHGFIPCKENNRYIYLSGKYCIEFNTFYATPNGLHILKWWCDRCLECCTAKADGVYFGDQKYLDDWQERFSGVYVLRNPGAGVAPWNLARFELLNRSNELTLKEKKTGKIVPLVFYHYQCMHYCAHDVVDIGVYMYPCKVSTKLRDIIYKEYLIKIKLIREYLCDKYNLNLDKCEQYVIPPSKKQLLIKVLCYERDPQIAIKKIWRILFRKDKDIMLIS